MKKLNVCFDNTALKLLCNALGKSLVCYKSDPFMYSTSVYGIVGIKIEDIWLTLTNFVEVMDYFGDDEDVAVLKLLQSDEEYVHSYTGENMITTPINAKITGIDIINENQQLYKNGEQTYDVWITRGIIFKLEDNREVLFEKDVWLSEDIIIEKGEKLITKLAPLENFSDNWEGDYRGVAIRNIIELPVNEIMADIENNLGSE